MKYDASFIRMILMMARSVREHELGCDECWREVDRFAELTLAGRDAAEALPLVEAHLKGCPECGAEFEALLLSLRETTRTSAIRANIL